MFEIHILKQDLFFEKSNKIVVINKTTYLEFMKNILAINNKNIKSEEIKVNNLSLNEKNTLVIDMTSIASYCKLLYENGRIQEEHIKTKLENYKDRDIKQIKLSKEVLSIIKANYKRLINTEVVLDLDKIIKQYVQIEIGTPERLFKIINYLIKKSQIKQYILIYSRDVVDTYNLFKYIDNIKTTNVLKLEIVSEKSKLESSDNITMLKEMAYQTTGSDLYKMIKENNNISSKYIKENFFKCIIGKGEKVDIKTKDIDIINKKCKEILDLNDNETVQLKT